MGFVWYTIGVRKFCRVNSSALDAANYLLQLAKQDGEVLDAITLQKLLYYAQCWSLRDGYRLFDDDVEAWKHGPVVRSVYKAYSGAAKIVPPESPFIELTPDQMDLIQAVWAARKGVHGFTMSRAIHQDPSSAWSKARESLPATAESRQRLSLQDMAEDAERIELAAQQRLRDLWKDAERYQS